MLGTGRKDGNISVHDSVYKNLRDKILYGFLRPGESLTLRNLASEFKTSMTPVRDSVRRLTAEESLLYKCILFQAILKICHESLFYGFLS